MKTKLTKGALYMSYMGDLYIQWLLEQERNLTMEIMNDATITMSTSDVIVVTNPEMTYSFLVIDYSGVDPDEELEMDGMRITMRDLHEVLVQRETKAIPYTLGPSGSN